MNDDIRKMIELQELWNQVLQSRSIIERSQKSIQHWDKQVSELEEKAASLKKDLKQRRAELDSSELELSEIEQKVSNLENRRVQLKTQKEVDAIDHELQKNNTDKNTLEEKMINLMEMIDNLEKDSADVANELDDVRKQAGEDIKMLQEKIQSAIEDEQEKKQKFDEGVNELSAEYRSRFLKLSGATHGKAIVPIDGEICQGCNFQVPVSIVVELGDNEKPVICTNCGRFIYRK